MPSASRLRGRRMRRARLSSPRAALAAVAVGALHGGAATPADAERRRARQGRPDRARHVDRDDPGRQRRTRRATATAPASASTTRRSRVTIPRKGYDTVRRDLHVPDHLDAEQPVRRRDAERRGADGELRRRRGRRRHRRQRGRLERRRHDTRRPSSRTTSRPGTYHALACGFVNSTPQPYTGTLTVQTVRARRDDVAAVGGCAGARVLGGGRLPTRSATRRSR